MVHQAAAGRKYIRYNDPLRYLGQDMRRYPETMSDPARRQVAAWLLLCCAMIFAMVILGGVTRLTGSGLSMVQWEPVLGVVPPLDRQQWQEAFHRYQAYPEYQKINSDMDLEGFKSIYWFEYAHRLLGRSIGLVFLLPFLYFLARRRLSRPLVPRLAIAFLLGGLQGLLGWYMVRSGLADDPHVSQYRLTAHLALALLVYCYLLWLLLDLVYGARPGARPGGERRLRRAAALLGLLIATTIASGGFVAGLKAGFSYNTFPLMAGQWLPPSGWVLQPGWRNLFENAATVQFDHRVLATVTLVSVVLFWFRARSRVATPGARPGIDLLLLAALLQVTLGISTLLLRVPVALAAAHQAGAVTLLSVILFVNHRLRRA